jgi:hypothetical protein
MARTSAGEHEELTLEPAFCTTARITIYYCHAMLILMYDGHNIAQIEPALNRIDIRFTSVVPSGLGGGWDFTGNFDTAMRPSQAQERFLFRAGERLRLADLVTEVFRHPAN